MGGRHAAEEDYRFPEAIDALEGFISGGGRAMLHQLAAGESGLEWRIAQALFLWAGHNQAQKTRAMRTFDVPLDATGVSRARDAHARVISRSQAALLRGHRTGMLTAADVDAIRLCRIVEGMRGLGECFLPSHLGLHPLRPAEVTPWPLGDDEPIGWRIIRDHQARGTPVFLDDTTRQRLICVERWRTAPTKRLTLRVDDAVDYTWNGLMDASFDDLRVGDAVTFRYVCRHDDAAAIHPEMIRISRPTANLGQ